MIMILFAMSVHPGAQVHEADDGVNNDDHDDDDYDHDDHDDDDDDQDQDLEDHDVAVSVHPGAHVHEADLHNAFLLSRALGARGEGESGGDDQDAHDDQNIDDDTEPSTMGASWHAGFNGYKQQCSC